MPTFLHQALDVCKVLFERFGVVLEVTCRFCEETGNGLHTKLLQEFWQNDTAHTIHAIECYAEVRLPDSLNIHEVQSEHHVDVFLVVCVIIAVRAEMIYVCIFEVLCLSDAKHFVTLLLVEEFTLRIE